MAGFSLIRNINQVVYRVMRIASQAYTLGDAVHQDRTSDAIDIVPATASSTTVNIFGVCMETVASTATSVLVAVADPTQEWVTDSANNSNTNHNYQRMILTNKAVVNNTGTDDTTVNAVFTQTGTTGTAASKRIIGRFNAVANVTA